MQKNRLALALALAFPLALSAQTQEASLRTVTVPAPRDSYVPAEVSVTTRDAVPIEQVPQSVIGVTRKLIDDLGAQSVSDALQSVSNVRSVDQRDFYNEQFRVRGFRAATLLDGVAMPSQFANLETTANIERIDVLKGPAPAISSGSQAAGAFGFVGGTVAITTKSPEPVASREIGLRLGNRSERGAFFDINQPVNDTVGLRLVGEVQHNGSESDGVTFKRTSLFPSLAVRPGAGQELLVKLRVSRRSTLDYSGLPPEGTVLPAAYTLPRSLNIRASGQPDSESRADGIDIQWKQPINASWSYDIKLSHTKADVNQNGVFTDDFFAPNPGPYYFLSGLNLTQWVKSTTLSSTLKGEVDAGGLKHKLALGLDLDRSTDQGYMAYAPTPYAVIGTLDITAPVLPAWVAPLPVLPGAQQDNRYRSTALFVQDRITLGRNLHLLAALRHTSIKVDNVWPDFLVNNVSSHSKTTPRIGAVYEFTPAVSAFAGYGEGMSIPTNGIYTTPPRPEGAKQSEIGVRLKNFNGLNATVAWFDLARTNVPVGDPAHFGQSIQTGEQRSSGIDIDWVYSASKALTLLGHYTHQNPRVTQDTVLTVGNQLFNTPKTSARLALRYEFSEGGLRGLGAGLGVNYRSAVPGNTSNSFFTPAATVWDAQLSYVTGAARYALAISNLTDRPYYEPSAYFTGGHVTPAPRRQVSLTASYRF